MTGEERSRSRRGEERSRKREVLLIDSIYSNMRSTTSTAEQSTPSSGVHLNPTANISSQQNIFITVQLQTSQATYFSKIVLQHKQTIATRASRVTSVVTVSLADLTELNYSKLL